MYDPNSATMSNILYFHRVGAIAHYIMVKTDSTKGAVSISIGRKAYEKCEPKQISTKGAESIAPKVR
jgi:hypothetical protein